jgi:hypothetical protein
MKLIMEIEDVRDLEAWKKAIESTVQAMGGLFEKDPYTVAPALSRAHMQVVRRVGRLLHRSALGPFP